MSRIRAAIADLASEFAEGVLAVIRSASVQEILAETGAAAAEMAARGVRRAAERSAGGAARAGSAAGAPAAKAPGGDAVERIVALLASHPKGLRAEEIRAKLGLGQKDLPKRIAEALASKRIVKEGERRATRYFAAAAKAAKKAAVAKRGAAVAKSKSANKAKRTGNAAKTAKAEKTTKAQTGAAAAEAIAAHEDDDARGDDEALEGSHEPHVDDAAHGEHGDEAGDMDEGAAVEASGKAEQLRLGLDDAAQEG